MTENQEKELFLILGKLVNGVSEIQLDIREMKGTLGEHSGILAEHSGILAEHSGILAEHSNILAEHTLRFDRLESKIDSVAIQVMENDKRATARFEAIESAVEDLGGKVH